MAKDSDSKKIDYIQERVDSVADVCKNIDKEVALQKAAFDDHLKQDERMYEEFKRMNDILQQNTDSLKEHMHRSDLLEKLVQKMEERYSPVAVEFERKTAVQKWTREKMRFLVRLGGVMATIGSLWMFLRHILHLV